MVKIKLSEFKLKLEDLGYTYKIQKEKLIIKDDHSEFYDFCVAEILLDEEFAVDTTYCIPFKEELWILIYELISTPLENRI